jgi:hypothetical protein
LRDFGYALLHSGQFEVLQQLIAWVSRQVSLFNGDWRVLLGEALRLQAENERVLAELEPLESQPPAAATRALTYFGCGNTTLAVEAAVAGLGEEYAGKVFNHPLGDPKAICMAVQAIAAANTGDIDAAIRLSERAVEFDGQCPFAWLGKAKILWSASRQQDAVAAAEEGLHRCPGDPNLYEWYQERCMERSGLDAAMAMQEEMRCALLSRNKNALFYGLAARIAEARFDEPATRVRMLIRAGEGTGLEFKSTLRWNIRAGKNDEEMTYACLKTIAAFLNTNGGILLIGLADDGTILGIGQDGFATNDQFLQHLSNKILAALGQVAAANIESRVLELDGLRVCEVSCRPSKSPIYLRSRAEEEFYVRTGPRSDRLPASKLVEYVLTRFSG